MCEKSPHEFYCHIIPSDMLRRIAEQGNDQQREAAYRAIDLSSHMRGRREAINNVALVGAVPAGAMRRTVYDAKNSRTLPGLLARSEDSPAPADVTVNEAFDGAGKTYEFYKSVFNRNSIDDRGLRLDSTVHFDEDYNNAFWNGQQMVYGDGDGTIFNRFTIALDVIAHELTHGITQYEADLIYQDQPGALNEHFSDVFGVLTVQFAQDHTVTQADWLIGKGLLAPGINGVALRSMKAPGTAFNDPLIGKDRQPAHMKDFVKTTDDNGGVHINSGIPNKAFHNFAVSLGGRAWEKAGRVWYTTLCNELSSNASFEDCALKTYKVARDLYGASVAAKVRAAWKSVGLNVAPVAASKTPAGIKKQAATKSPPLKKAAGKKGTKKAAK
jgi:Zn-dependent metalloprotease